MTTEPSASGTTIWPAYEVLTAPRGSVSQSRADLLGACQNATEQASRALLVNWLKKACSEESLTEARLQALSGNPISGQQLLEDIFDELVDDHDTLRPTAGAPEKVQDLTRELSPTERSRLQELSELIYDQLSRVSPRRPGMPDCAPMLRLERHCVVATTWLMATSGPLPVPSAQELCHALMWNVEEDRDVQALGDIDFTKAPRLLAAPKVSTKSSGHAKSIARTPQTLARFFNLHVGLDHAGTKWVILGNWAAGESALEKALNQHGATRLGGDMDAREHLSDVAISLAEHLCAVCCDVKQHPLMEAASGEVLSRVGHSWMHGQADPDEPDCPWTPEQAYLLAWGGEDD